MLCSRLKWIYILAFIVRDSFLRIDVPCKSCKIILREGLSGFTNRHTTTSNNSSNNPNMVFINPLKPPYQPTVTSQIAKTCPYAIAIVPTIPRYLRTTDAINTVINTTPLDPAPISTMLPMNDETPPPQRRKRKPKR